MAGYIGSQTPVVSNGSQRKYTFTATAAQTVFTGMDIPNPQQIQVFQNGVRLVITTDYTVSSGTTVTLVNAASAGDSLVVILFADYQLLDQDLSGDFSVDSPTFVVDSASNNVGIGTSSLSNGLRTVIQGSQTGGAPATSGTTQTYGLLRLQGTTFTSALDMGTNGGNYAWIQSTDQANLATNYSLVLNPNGGNVGIGTSSPATPLDVTKAGGGNFVATFQNTTSATPYGVHIKDAASGANGYPLLQVTNSAGSQAYLRVDSGTGNTTLGSFNASGGSVGVLFDIGGGTSETEIQTSVNGTATRTHYKFINNNGAVGTITTNGSATAYNTSSDHRLKENVTDVTDGITRVKQLEPKRFNFIADPDKTVDGFLAHEAQAVVPEAVTGTHNEVDDDGNAVMQGIDQSKLVPLLTAALKESIAKIEALEARVTALEGN